MFFKTFAADNVPATPLRTEPLRDHVNLDSPFLMWLGTMVSGLRFCVELMAYRALLIFELYKRHWSDEKRAFGAVLVATDSVCRRLAV